MESEEASINMTAAELAHLRRMSKMTQAHMAEALGITVRGYQKLEGGESPIKHHYSRAAQFTVIERIAAGFPSDDAAINDLVLRAWKALEASKPNPAAPGTASSAPLGCEAVLIGTVRT
ncbi:helix-turn-helix domain-containing protein [Neorhizobium sp. T786]|uniref:helix-turn-helix domain-containing protein n=1 Tax=Pseudorhizobium xiangyangii TaxID=2883104 RepID=UPI001CFFE428|nr:helix-turn-helix transcriptional regulator [Neorhizobium xiangyangii]MCB5203805.1 helix-turn-helix domain-containing protein [Neorhizobium xiangyangii]